MVPVCLPLVLSQGCGCGVGGVVGSSPTGSASGELGQASVLTETVSPERFCHFTLCLEDDRAGKESTDECCNLDLCSVTHARIK